MRMLFRRRPADRGSVACRFRPSSGVVAARQGGRTILLDARHGEYFGMDEVGAEIWRLLEGGSTVEQVVDALEQEYEVSREQLARDAADFVWLLARKRLVVSA